jgi:hypothetical protein
VGHSARDCRNDGFSILQRKEDPKEAETMTTCNHSCPQKGDDGLCFAESPSDCPRALLTEDDFDDLEDDLEEEELEEMGEET